MSQQGALEDESGFTLVEVIVTIIIMGILFGIATSTWFGAIESRKVDSASNQLAADLRLAHTRATNRLENWQVVLDADSSYTIGPTGSPTVRDLDDDPNDPTPDTTHRVVVDATVTITFKPDGSATVAPAGTNTFQIKSSRDANKCRAVQITETTSRINLVTC
jgi:prepilin-type N-terminal cleavage/methylation domain-containing protein